MWLYRIHWKKYFKHQAVIHEGERVQCDICELKCTTKYSLRDHKKSIHEGNVFCCDLCDYKANIKGFSKWHKAMTHEGKKFECVLCEYKGNQSSSLTRHKRIYHTNIETKLGVINAHIIIQKKIIFKSISRICIVV